NGIRRASIDLDESDQTLAIAAPWFLDAETPASQRGHAHAQYLSGAQMAVGNLRLLQQFVQRLHATMLCLFAPLAGQRRCQQLLAKSRPPAGLKLTVFPPTAPSLRPHCWPLH